MTTSHVLGEFEARIAGGAALSREDVARVVECPDLVSVGVVGELARRVRSGAVVTFGRVLESVDGDIPADADAGEVRLTAEPTSIEEATALVRRAVAGAGSTPVTGFSLPALAALCGGSAEQLETASRTLATAGLTGVAAVPLDRADGDDTLVTWIRAARAGGLAVARLTVDEAPGWTERLALIERAAAVSEAVGGIKAFAPLPRIDSVETPSTGYDDAKLVAAARLRCGAIDVIQVDWPLYGPKLAQVALTFGAGDIDGVSAVGNPDLGPRRSPLEDIRRQIRAAGADPVERDARYVTRG